MKLWKEFLETKKPVLCICLGMQLLFDYSFEFGKYQGLGIIKGNVKSGDEIFFNNKKIGNISSINNDIGLAMMRIEDSKNAYDNKIELNTKNGKILVNF